MNTSVLEGAISEQLFCNKKVNPNNEPCYGISTVSGLQRAAQQGQKIYQINQKNRAQLKNIAMSGKEMANDINKAIASGGYVIVPEKAVDGTGRNAIYVYMTYNAQDGYQTWKISGGLNGGFLQGLIIGFSIGLLISALVLSVLTGLFFLAFLLVFLVIAVINYADTLEILYKIDNPELAACYSLGLRVGKILGGLFSFMGGVITGKNPSFAIFSIFQIYGQFKLDSEHTHKGNTYEC